jgi:hypothetical protein
LSQSFVAVWVCRSRDDHACAGLDGPVPQLATPHEKAPPKRGEVIVALSTSLEGDAPSGYLRTESYHRFNLDACPGLVRFALLLPDTCSYQTATATRVHFRANPFPSFIRAQPHCTSSRGGNTGAPDKCGSYGGAPHFQVFSSGCPMSTNIGKPTLVGFRAPCP